MPQVKKRTLWIKDEHETLYVPRPSGWLSGWARHIWFEKHMHDRPQIASPELWDQLIQRYPIQELIEYEDGEIVIREITRDST